jgi:hypothetical protein
MRHNSYTESVLNCVRCTKLFLKVVFIFHKRAVSSKIPLLRVCSGACLSKRRMQQCIGLGHSVYSVRGTPSEPSG